MKITRVEILYLTNKYLRLEEFTEALNKLIAVKIKELELLNG